MPELLETTERDSPADRDRIARVNRNRRIRSDYESLKERYGRRGAVQRLKEQHNLSASTVRAIIYKKR